MRTAGKIIAAFLVVTLLLTGWWMMRGSGHWVAEFSTEADKNVLIIHLDSNLSQRAKILLPQTEAYPTAQVILDNLHSPLPHGKIVFIDNTVLPGRVIIEIDGHQLDIMSRAIITNGTEYPWAQATTIELPALPQLSFPPLRTENTLRSRTGIEP